MNILYIAGTSPLEASFGAAQRTRLLWQALRKLGTVYTVVATEERNGCAPDEVNKIHWINLSEGRTRVGKGLGMLLQSKHAVRERVGWPEIEFDLVVTRYLRGASVCSAWKIAPCYIDVDDLPLEFYRTTLKPKYGKIKGMFFDWAYRAWTHYVLSHATAAWISNETQKALVEKYCPCAVLPNIPLEPRVAYQMNGRQQTRLLTIGLMSYRPNHEGVDWFLDNIWPAIHRRFPELIFSIGGKGTPTHLAAKWSKMAGVEQLGFVEDLEAAYESALAVVASVNSGSGTCIKVLEACVHGRHVLATPFAVRGLTGDKCAELKILVSSTAEDYVKRLMEILALSEDERTRRQMDIAAALKGHLSVETFNSRVRSLIQDR